MKLKPAIGGSLTVWFLVLLFLEAVRPLRTPSQEKFRRLGTNGLIAGVTAILLLLCESPFTSRLSRRVKKNKLGLLNQLKLPEPLRVSFTVVLLDYGLYLWHVINHKLPLLWRFHIVHHIDLDLDASTAVRFHFGEMAISVLWRLMQIRVIGVNPIGLLVWQTLLMFSILFHHSNVKLPAAWEKWLNLFIVTPRMHGIHHSVLQKETDSNWSSGLTIWDKLHGTFRSFDPPNKIVIGVPAYREKENLVSMLALPFKKQRPTWQFNDEEQVKQ
jgi:sterol desaturase/sphingolipid hydroxylase (fatty acid hydroxylase superfamily)